MMKTAVLLVFFMAIVNHYAWAELGETRQAIQARYQTHLHSVPQGEGVKPLHDNPMEFHQKSRVVLVWFHEGRSIAEMFLCPHGLKQEQLTKLLAREAGTSSWVAVQCNQNQARLWARKDHKAITWVTGSDSQFAVFASVKVDELEKLGRNASFKTVAVKCPKLWARVVDLASTERMALKPGSQVAGK